MGGLNAIERRLARMETAETSLDAVRERIARLGDDDLRLIVRANEGAKLTPEETTRLGVVLLEAGLGRLFCQAAA